MPVLGTERKISSFHALQDGCLMQFIKKMQSVLHMETCNPVSQIKDASPIVHQHNASF